MPVFNYEAKNINGQVIKNKMEAYTKEEVIASIRARGYFPITVQKEGTGLNKEINLDIFDKVELKDIAMFCRQFAFAIQSGTNMLRCIEITIEQCENKKLKTILKRVRQQVEKGRSLSEALKYESEIPNLMINMIQAGEVSGRLDYIMNELSIYYDKAYKQKQKINQATIYPKLVVIFAIIIVGFLITTVVPSFVENLADVGGELPLPTALLMGISNFMTSNFLIVIAVAAIIFGFKKLVLDKDPMILEKRGKRKLRGKLFGAINRQLIAGRFANTFSILSSSGVNVIKSLELTALVLENKYVEKKLNQAKEDIQRGNEIGKTIEDLNLFPVMLTQMITVGEETGQLEEIMKKTSEFYDGEVEMAIQKLTTMIEPLLLIGLSVVVLFIILAMMLPMFNMMDMMV